MSTNYNRRRGGKANGSRRPRLCNEPVQREGMLVACHKAVRPDRNGNKCEDHR